MKAALHVMLAIAIAPEHLGQGAGPPMTSVQGRIVVEPTYPSPFPEEFSLTFADAKGNATLDVVVSENIRATSFRYTRGGMSGDVKLQKDGTFQLLLRPGEYQVILRRRPLPAKEQAAGYFLKAVRAGDANLLVSSLIVKETFPGELVITLVKCTSLTQADCVK